MNTLFERQLWAKRRIRDWWITACDAYGAGENVRNRVPVVEFSNRMTRAAGYAYRNSYRIKLSNHFLQGETPESYDQTIGHEVAHIFADRWWNKDCKHGPLWQQCMSRMGLRVERTHKFKSQKPVVRQDRISYVCTGCEKTIKISKNRVGRIRNGSVYYCVKCKTIINTDSVLATSRRYD